MINCFQTFPCKFNLRRYMERGVNELCDMVRGYPRENPEVPLSDTVIAGFTKHYAKLMYQAILSAGAYTRPR